MAGHLEQLLQTTSRIRNIRIQLRINIKSLIIISVTLDKVAALSDETRLGT